MRTHSFSAWHKCPLPVSLGKSYTLFPVLVSVLPFSPPFLLEAVVTVLANIYQLKVLY